MHIDQMRRLVFKFRPRLKKIYEKEGKSTVAEYARKIYVRKQPSDRVIIDAVVSVTEKIFGADVVGRVRESLSKNNYVSTVDHHGPICHPSFFQPDLLRTILDKEAGIPATVVLSCASVSLNNHSFPRGLYFHTKDGEEIRLPIFGVQHRRACVYGQRSFTKEEARVFLSRLEAYRELKHSLAPIFSDENIHHLERYRFQVALINHRLLQAINMAGSDFVSVPIEDVVREVFVSHHFGKDTFISRILFHKKTRDIFLEETDGIQTSHDLARENTTVLFWGVGDNSARIPLRLQDGALVSQDMKIRVAFDTAHVGAALREEKIFPNLALCLIVLSFHGMVLGGGFSQVDYLPELIRKVRRVFSRIGKKGKGWPAAGFMGGDFIFLPQCSNKDVTLADFLNQPAEKAGFVRYASGTVLRDAIESIVPDVYAIIADKLKRKKTCPYCGNNPAPHFLSWIASTFSIMVVNPVVTRLFRTRLGQMLYGIAAWILARFFDLLALVGIIKFSSDPSVISASRGRVMFEDAIARGWGIETALVYGRPTDIYKVVIPEEKPFFFNGLPRPDIDESPAVGWMDDKALLKQALEKENIPVSQGQSFSNWHEAKRYFDTAKKPLIVKPRLGSRGRHTTTNITKLDDFKKAFAVAKQLGRFVVVEEHLFGSVFRATVIDGKLVGVLAGDPPRITGNGMSTLRDLIGMKNRKRDQRMSEVIISDMLISFLKRQHLTLDDVLGDGVTIDVSEKIGLAYGGKSREVTPFVHPKLRNELERAAKVVDDPVLGFDFIIEDVTIDPDMMRWGIIECNAVPFINLHHDPLEGEPVNAAAKLWDYVLQKKNI